MRYIIKTSIVIAVFLTQGFTTGMFMNPTSLNGMFGLQIMTELGKPHRFYWGFEYTHYIPKIDLDHSSNVTSGISFGYLRQSTYRSNIFYSEGLIMAGYIGGTIGGFYKSSKRFNNHGGLTYSLYSVGPFYRNFSFDETDSHLAGAYIKMPIVEYCGM